MTKSNDILKGKIEVELNGTKYAGTVNLTAIQQPAVEIKNTAPNYATYGIVIDTKNKDPFNSVEYIGAAKGMKPAKANDPGDWLDIPPFNTMESVLLRNGKVEDYLNPNDLSQLKNGKEHKIAAADGFDFMQRYNKTYYRFSRSGQYLMIEIAFSEEALKDGFIDWAFSYANEVYDKIYLGIYKGVVIDGRLRSLPGYMPTGNITVGQSCEFAQANGKGYDINSQNKNLLMQILYLIRFKSRYAQAALGKGRTYSSGPIETGSTDRKGLYYGSEDGTEEIKCHGLEGWYGNKLEWLGGLMAGSGAIRVSDGPFNGTGEGYKKVANLNKTVGGRIVDVHGTNELGFLIKKGDGNRGEHYNDWGSVYHGGTGDISLPLFGGYWSGGSDAGAFQLACNSGPSDASSHIGARLTFVGNE